MLTTFSGRKASQDPDELAAFIALLVDRRVTRYLEIGARHGDTFHTIVLALPEGSYGLALDLPGGLWGPASPGRHLVRAVMTCMAGAINARRCLPTLKTGPRCAW